jgi:hypothetical protein
MASEPAIYVVNRRVRGAVSSPWYRSSEWAALI